MRYIVFALSGLLLGCSANTGVANHDKLIAFVEEHPVGNGSDQWIEMRNLSGEWEKTGLVFGYSTDDAEECAKAIAGLKRVNFAREYRCSQANTI